MTDVELFQTYLEKLQEAKAALVEAVRLKLQERPVIDHIMVAKYMQSANYQARTYQFDDAQLLYLMDRLESESSEDHESAKAFGVIEGRSWALNQASLYDLQSIAEGPDQDEFEAILNLYSTEWRPSPRSKPAELADFHPGWFDGFAMGARSVWQQARAITSGRRSLPLKATEAV